MLYRLNWNPTTTSVALERGLTVLPATSVAAQGYEELGTFTHGPPQEDGDLNHVLYHHVKTILEENDIFNMQQVEIYLVADSVPVVPPEPPDLIPLFPAGGIYSTDQAQLTDKTKATAFAGTYELKADSIRLAASSSVTFGNTGPLTGHYWALTCVDMDTPGSGTARPRFLNPAYSPEALRNREGNHVWQFPALAGSLDLQFQSGTGWTGELQLIQLYEMASILAQPADIYLALGQSNMAATANSFGLDPLLDTWADRRLLYFPGSTQTSYGATKGKPTGLVAPLQTNGVASGVSPACEFARYVARFTPTNRNVVIIQAAQGGTGLLAADAPWNPDGSSPTAYSAAIALINEAKAALPAGSVIKGALWAQGESDGVENLAQYPAAFANMRSKLQTAIGSGQIPWMLILPPSDASRANQAQLIDMQSKMDANSGHAYSQPLVHCVARPTGFMEDTTHVNAAGQRAAGKLTGQAFRAKGYLT